MLVTDRSPIGPVADRLLYALSSSLGVVLYSMYGVQVGANMTLCNYLYKSWAYATSLILH